MADSNDGVFDTVTSGVGTAASTVGNVVSTAAGAVADVGRRAVRAVVPGSSALRSRARSGDAAKTAKKKKKAGAAKSRARKTSARKTGKKRTAKSRAQDGAARKRGGTEDGGAQAAPAARARRETAREVAHPARRPAAARRSSPGQRRKRRLPLRSSAGPGGVSSHPLDAGRGQQAGPGERAFPEALVHRVAHPVALDARARGRTARAATGPKPDA